MCGSRKFCQRGRNLTMFCFSCSGKKGSKYYLNMPSSGPPAKIQIAFSFVIFQVGGGVWTTCPYLDLSTQYVHDFKG